MNHLSQRENEDQELVLTEKEQNYLGPGLVLRRCHIVLRTSQKALTITDVKMIDCRIEAKAKCSNYQMWCGAVISGCRFTGTFVGNDFGYWPEQFPGGAIERCDFEKAILDGCRLMNASMDSIKLPKWPCFAVLNPVGNRQELEAVKWPGKLKYWAADLPTQPPITSALIEYGPTLAKQFGCSEDDLRKALVDLSNVLM